MLEERVPEGLWPGESYYLRAPVPPERRRQSSARTLERVVPVAQKRTVGDATAAISSLEIHGQGVGALRWRISMGEDALSAEPDFWFGTPEPEFEILADGDRSLKWSPMGGGMNDRDSDGEAEVWELPETGELRVTVTRLTADAYGPEGDHLEEATPWTVRGASGSPSDRAAPLIRRPGKSTGESGGNAPRRRPGLTRYRLAVPKEAAAVGAVGG